MPGRGQDVHVAERRELRAAAADARRASGAAKARKARARKLAGKARDIGRAEERDRKAARVPRAWRSSAASAAATGSRFPAANGTTARQQHRHAGELLQRVRAGRAALDALAAKFAALAAS